MHFSDKNKHVMHDMTVIWTKTIFSGNDIRYSLNDNFKMTAPKTQKVPCLYSFGPEFRKRSLLIHEPYFAPRLPPSYLSERGGRGGEEEVIGFGGGAGESNKGTYRGRRVKSKHFASSLTMSGQVITWTKHFILKSEDRVTYWHINRYSETWGNKWLRPSVFPHSLTLYSSRWFKVKKLVWEINFFGDSSGTIS